MTSEDSRRKRKHDLRFARQNEVANEIDGTDCVDQVPRADHSRSACAVVKDLISHKWAGSGKPSAASKTPNGSPFPSQTKRESTVFQRFFKRNQVECDGSVSSEGSSVGAVAPSMSH